MQATAARTGLKVVLLFIPQPIRLSGDTRLPIVLRFEVPAMSVTSFPATRSLQMPPGGEAITLLDGRLQVPARPVIPFIEGDGTGPDIWHASQYVFDQAVERAYRGQRRIAWLE